MSKSSMTALVRAVHVSAAVPSLADNTADLDRLKRALHSRVSEEFLFCPFHRMSEVAGQFRANSFQGAALLNDTDRGLELVDVAPGMPEQLAGMALDLGTTHLEAVLVDLLSGRVTAKTALSHGQSEFGPDILSRIHYADRPGGLDRIKQVLTADINALAVELADRTGIRVLDIRALSIAGNTAMTHFLLGLDPHHLCREPYIPVSNSFDLIHAADLGLEINPDSPVWIAPNVGSYVGGDLLAGIIACDLDLAQQPSMLIDVGTNAEVVLGGREWLLACAGAAGPALEGGVVKMGTRAGPGAIDQISIDADSGNLSFSTIGGGMPRGICGSGLIDLAAGLYLAGMIDTRGRFRPEAMGGRYIEDEHGLAFVVAKAEETASEQAISVSQSDINALLRSKAAMYAVLSTLVEQVGLSFADLSRINVAGAFGRHIHPRRAVVLGMLPDLPPEAYHPVGNTSLAGAVKILTNGGARKRVRDTAKRITYIELNVNQEFMHRFSGARFIPHTDVNLFPSVPV